MVTMANSSQPTAASAPLGAISSAQIILHTIKLQTPPAYKGEIDFEVIEAWIYNADNYFALIGLNDPSQQAHFSTTLILNAAALWLHNLGVNLNAV